MGSQRLLDRVLVAGLVVCASSLIACGGSGNSPTAPSSPSYPAVAGNYAGTVTFTLTTLGGSLNCPTTTTVTQSGANVTFTPLAFSGNCAAIGSLPLASDTISTSGSLSNVTQNNVPIASCNGSYNLTSSGGFSGSTLQFSFSYTAVTGGCVSSPGSFSFSGTLVKQ